VSQFSTQCVLNWKCHEKRAHVPQVRGGEPPAEVGGQPLRYRFEKGSAVPRSALTALLMLHDQSANLPVREHHRRVH
jgi:hypothetical protein